MKSTAFLLVFIILAAIGTKNLNAQEQKTSQSKIDSLEDDDGPIVFKFEPDYLSKNEQRKAEIARVRKIIDTLDISDKKRLKLVKDLYKVGGTRRLNKALLVETKFEDVDN